VSATLRRRAVWVAWLLTAVSASAEEPSPTQVPIVTAAETPVNDLARLHVKVGALGDVVSMQAGGEVGGSYGVNAWFDVGASVVVGSAVGGRVLLDLHPARAERGFLPYVQLRGAVHPVPGGVGLGGGLGLGVTVEAWRGRVFAQATGEVLHGPSTYLPWAALLGLGYEFDFFRTHHAEVQVVREVAPGGPSSSITGRVTDLDDAPLTAVVRLPGAQGALGATLYDASPEFAVPVPPGDYLVEVEAPGYLVRGRSVHVGPGQTLVLDLQLRKLPETRGAVLSQTAVEINQSIEFSLNKAVLLPKSFPILDEVVDVLLRNPAVVKLRIEGHTDQTGTRERNDELSAARAQAVLEYLCERGVQAERLLAVGYGFQQPVASNATEAGRAKNRRVQFVVQDRKPTR
jgi:outer membrane protein OmpA-like peptidoglycan-associated protein